jgi:hypothetical protein
MLPKFLFNPKNLHPDRDIVFQEDFSNFFNFLDSKIVNDEMLTYLNFKVIWKEKKMSLLHFIKSKEESIKEYYEVLFGEVQSNLKIN